MFRYTQRGLPMVYLDESGFAQDAPRTHGYSQKGLRCYGKFDWQAKGRVNAIGALAGKLLLTVCLFKGSINGQVFHSFIEEDLIPKLSEKTVIVMDNASFHKGEAVRNAIKQAGHILLFLPPYSPDLNPIEKKWAQLKSIRRKFQIPVEQLFQENFI